MRAILIVFAGHQERLAVTEMRDIVQGSRNQAAVWHGCAPERPSENVEEFTFRTIKFVQFNPQLGTTLTHDEHKNMEKDGDQWPQ
jgi:hypothetical protein